MDTDRDSKMERVSSQELQDDEFDPQEHQVLILQPIHLLDCADIRRRPAISSRPRIVMTGHQNDAAQRKERGKGNKVRQGMRLNSAIKALSLSC